MSIPVTQFTITPLDGGKHWTITTSDYRRGQGLFPTVKGVSITFTGMNAESKCRQHQLRVNTVEERINAAIDAAERALAS